MINEERIVRNEVREALEDLIHDIRGAPEEELTRLGVQRNTLLSAAQTVFDTVVGCEGK